MGAEEKVGFLDLPLSLNLRFDSLKFRHPLFSSSGSLYRIPIDCEQIRETWIGYEVLHAEGVSHDLAERSTV